MGKSPKEEHPVKAFGWAARDRSGFLAPFTFSRRLTGDEDVRFKILYCGICRSDLQSVKNIWSHPAKYPLVPGHEMVGIVTEVGSKVKKFKVGDKVGVGAMAGSCLCCNYCKKSLENYCPDLKLIFDFLYYDGTMTYGGFSDHMVVNEHFAFQIPENMPLDACGPLFCAGITTYSSLRYFGLDKPGQNVGVVGLGGLGHLAVKFAKAFGAKVTVISTSPNKKWDAIERLGVDSFVVSTDHDQMKAIVGTLDGIIDTLPITHALGPLIDTLKFEGKLVLVGESKTQLEITSFSLMAGRKIVSGSVIGGSTETQEMIDFAAKHNIYADIEIISMDYLNTAMRRLEIRDVKYRFVIDIGNTLKAT